MLKFYSLIFILSLGLASRGQAASLEQAQAAYEAGDYAKASELYLEDVQRGNPHANASVFHNLGLSFDRQKELGPAIAAYLRAVQLQPRQGDFAYNLQFLLGQTRDKLDSNFPVAPLDRLLLGRFSSEREIYYLTVVLLVVTALSVSCGILGRRLRKSAFAAGSLALLFTAYAGLSLIMKARDSYDTGAVSAEKIEAYSGPTESVVIFEIHAGAPFQIIDSSGSWVKIELSDQKRGWVRKDGITSFGRDDVILPAHVSSKS